MIAEVLGVPGIVLLPIVATLFLIIVGLIIVLIIVIKTIKVRQK